MRGDRLREQVLVRLNSEDRAFVRAARDRLGLDSEADVVRVALETLRQLMTSEATLGKILSLGLDRIRHERLRALVREKAPAETSEIPASHRG